MIPQIERSNIEHQQLPHRGLRDGMRRWTKLRDTLMRITMAPRLITAVRWRTRPLMCGDRFNRQNSEGVGCRERSRAGEACGTSGYGHLSNLQPRWQAHRNWLGGQQAAHLGRKEQQAAPLV